ncbi:hypothetical protein [Fervidobacterium sp.]
MSVLKRLEATLEEIKKDPRTARITVRMEPWIYQVLSEIGERHNMTATEVAYAALRAVAEEAKGSSSKATAKRRQPSDADTPPGLFNE